jgi:hypothetical protein
MRNGHAVGGDNIKMLYRKKGYGDEEWNLVSG